MARPIQSTKPRGLTPLRVRPAKPGDGLSVASRLRAEDRQELEAAGALLVAADLEEACKPGRYTFVGVTEANLPLLIFGTEDAPTFQSWGPSVSAFMLACDGIEQHARQLARESRPWVQTLLAQHGPDVCGHNLIDARNRLHMRWLSWCGAVFTGDEYFPTDPAIPFLEFYIPQCATQH